MITDAELGFDVPRGPSGILHGQDLAVAAWTWTTFKLTPMFINRAFGVLDDGAMIGSFIMMNFNGADIEACLHGKGFLTRGMVRFCADQVLATGVVRATVHVPIGGTRLRAWLGRVGKLECVRRDYYGTGRHAAQYAIARERIAKIAGGDLWAPAHRQH